MDILDSFFIWNGKIPSNAVGGKYDFVLVALSYAIAVIGTFTAIAVLRQIHIKSRSSVFWGRILGALVLGTCIWSMHFTGMLAFQMNMVHTYDLTLTICSMVASVLFSYAVFYNITRPQVTLLRFYLTALLMGAGIASMHYIGMAAMQMDGTMKYIPSLFFLSILIAIAVSVIAMRIMRYILQTRKDKEFLYVLVALIMAAGVCGLHYTGMAATVFIPFYDCRFDPNQTFIGLASSVIIASMVIVATTFIVLFSQRRTLKIIKEERRFIQTIIDSIPDPIFVKDHSHRWVAGNKSFWSILGHSDKYIGKNDRDIFPPEQVEVFWAKDDEVIKTGITNINEEYITCLDGRTILSLTTKSPLQMLDGSQGLVGVIHDIGAIKTVEQSLKSANQFKEAMLEASKYAIISTDVSGIIQSCNQAAQAMLGYSADEMIGKLSPTQFHTNEELTKCANKLALKYERPVEPGFEVFSSMAGQDLIPETEWIYIRKDGSTFPGSLSLSTLYKDKEKDKIAGYLGIITDISQRKQYEAELRQHRDHLQSMLEEQAENIRKEYEKNTQLEIESRINAEKSAKAISEFLSNMSHELRTPMHAILNYAQMGLKRHGTEQGEKIEKYFTNIKLAGNRLMGLLNNLLDLSKLNAGKMLFKFNKEDLKEAVEYTHMELDSLIKEKNIKVELKISTLDTKACFDKQHIIQVLVNIFSNAIKYSPKNGLINITLLDDHLSDGTELLLCRVDNKGDAIPENELELIFDKFVQSSKTKTGSGGTGLGLAISQEIIRAHGGKIWAENGARGLVVFSFYIPRMQVK